MRLTPFTSLLALLAILTAAAPAPCQQPASPGAPADALAADLLRDWEAQKARLIAVAEAMPADKYEFKATEAQRSFAEQLLHLAEAHVSMLKTLDPAGKVPPPTLSKSHARDDVIKSLGAAYDYGRAVLTALDAPAHQVAGKTTRARAVWAAMGNAMNHYGQLVVYLRLNGIVPPASRR